GQRSRTCNLSGTCFSNSRSWKLMGLVHRPQANIPIGGVPRAVRVRAVHHDVTAGRIERADRLRTTAPRFVLPGNRLARFVPRVAEAVRFFQLFQLFWRNLDPRHMSLPIADGRDRKNRRTCSETNSPPVRDSDSLRDRLPLRSPLGLLVD